MGRRVVSDIGKAAIDRRAHTLIAEFRAYVKECRAEDGFTDERLIFESWAIQKIASVQLVCFTLMRDIEPLEQERRLIAAERDWRKAKAKADQR